MPRLPVVVTLLLFLATNLLGKTNIFGFSVQLDVSRMAADSLSSPQHNSTQRAHRDFRLECDLHIQSITVC